MNRYVAFLSAVVFSIGSTQLHAQFGPRGGGMGGPPSGPSLGGEMAKLFGENKAFSASLEFQVKEGGKGEPMTMPGRISFLDGKSRFEMDLAKVKGGQIPPEAAAQMKQMGMDKMIAISLPEEKVTYMIYPGLESYVVMPIQDPDAAKAESEFDMEVSELGKESVDGRNCIKNKVIVTDKEGKSHESTVWNATGLNQFPVKIETNEEGNHIVLLFRDVKLSKPDADDFDPPSTFKKYDNMMVMMQQVMMKMMGGGMPPGQ